jgi:hypothetical protein
MRTDGRTDMKLIVAFRNFANATKKICPRTGHEGSEGEKRYSSTLS